MRWWTLGVWFVVGLLVVACGVLYGISSIGGCDAQGWPAGCEERGWQVSEYLSYAGYALLIGWAVAVLTKLTRRARP